jgi:hypothetical protein
LIILNMLNPIDKWTISTVGSQNIFRMEMEESLRLHASFWNKVKPIGLQKR